MDQYAGSVAYLDGNVIKAKIFVCEADQISEAHAKLTKFIADIGIPEKLVIDKRVNLIEIKDNTAYIGGFATLRSGNIVADFAILFAQSAKQFVEILRSGYKNAIFPDAVLIDKSCEVKQLSEF